MLVELVTLDQPVFKDHQVLMVLKENLDLQDLLGQSEILDQWGKLGIEVLIIVGKKKL